MALIKKTLTIIACCTALALLNSCVGVSAEISLNADGSGKIALEYRVSQMLESLGRLDGNENWPAIPVGRGDFERSVARIPGLRLSSFSAKSVPAKGDAAGGQDLLTKAVLQFKDTAALLAFLDSTGVGASSLTPNQLRLVLAEPAEGLNNSDLLSLLKEISAGYEISVSLNAPKNASLNATPANLPAVKLVSPGKKVSAAIGTGELFSLKEGLALEFEW